MSFSSYFLRNLSQRSYKHDSYKGKSVYWLSNGITECVVIDCIFHKNKWFLVWKCQTIFSWTALGQRACLLCPQIFSIKKDLRLTLLSCVLNSTFNATMNLVDFSRAKYTFPNFPFPSCFPISKHSSVHCFFFSPPGTGSWFSLNNMRGSYRKKKPRSDCTSTVGTPMSLTLLLGPVDEPGLEISLAVCWDETVAGWRLRSASMMRGPRATRMLTKQHGSNQIFESQMSPGSSTSGSTCTLTSFQLTSL